MTFVLKNASKIYFNESFIPTISLWNENRFVDEDNINKRILNCKNEHGLIDVQYEAGLGRSYSFYFDTEENMNLFVMKYG